MTEDIIELTLNSPITEEQWDVITDVDFENTDRIWFHTKHGKEVEFIKHIRGQWINHRKDRGHNIADCDQCGGTLQWLDPDERPNFCPNCGADMRQREEEQDD